MEPKSSSSQRKQHKPKSSVPNHRISPSLPIITFEKIQEKILNLEKKYSHFVSAYISSLQPPLQSQKNKKIINPSKEMKKYSNNSSPTDEPSSLSSIVEKFVDISKVIPHQFEDQFTDFKAETLKFIFHLQNKVPKAFQSASPENKRSKGVEVKRHFANLRVKDSNIETEETDLVFYTGELTRSRDSPKGLSARNLPRLKLNRIEEFSPIQARTERNCVSSSRGAKGKMLFSTLRDSINTENELVEDRLKETLKFFRKFMKNVQNLCENYPEPEEKVELIIRKCKDFYETLEKIENDEELVTSDEAKLRDELENCKKIALMYEKKMKMKNETLLVLRNKEKGWIEKCQKFKKILVLFNENCAKKENEFFGKVVEKIGRINAQFTQIKQKIEKNLQMGLEELKKAWEMTSKSDFFDEENEELQKQIQELEFNNKGLFDRNKKLEFELKEHMEKYFELENMVEMMKKSQETDFTAQGELENLMIETENLKKILKIKEFELKQKEFENSALDSDKSELLTRIESLEIEKIESHECINSLTIKYNQEIENFVYNNTVQRNKIQSLEKEKEEILNQKTNFEGKVKEVNKEICVLKEKFDQVLKQNQEFNKKILELEKIRKEKMFQDTKLAGFEKILEENERLEKTVVELQQSLNQATHIESPLITLIEPLEIFQAKVQTENIPEEASRTPHEDASTQATYTDIKNYTDQILHLETELKSFQSQNVSLHTEISSLQSSLSTLPTLSSKLLSLKSKKNSLKLKIKTFESSISQISEQNKSLSAEIQDFQITQGKLESINAYLIEDLRLRQHSYKETLEDLKLDKYQYEKLLKSYETQLEFLHQSFNSLNSRLDSIVPIPETLNEALAASLSQNQIDSSTKNIYLNKIAQLEEDVQNLTSKLLKKNNENSILEDCLMVYSPRAMNSTSSQEETRKVKCELIEAHKSLEESANEKKVLQMNLAQGLSHLEDCKKSLEKNKENFADLEKRFKVKCEENLGLKKNYDEIVAENERLSKMLSEVKSNLKNLEVTYTKNLGYLEEQVKKYRRIESGNKGGSVLSPRSVSADFQISKEESVVISACEKLHGDEAPHFGCGDPGDDSLEEASFHED